MKSVAFIAMLQALALATIPTLAAASAPYVSKYGQMAAQYQATYDGLSTQGYHPTLVDTHVLAGQVQYASAWVYDPNIEFRAWHDQPSDAYRQTYTNMAGQGFRLVCVDTHVRRNVTYYASIWIHDPTVPFHGWHDQSESRYHRPSTL